MKLGAAQRERLNRIAKLKKEYDHKLAALEAEQRFARDALRDPLRREIASAIERDGTSKRQVCLAMGMQQQNQLAGFIEPLAGRTARTVDALIGAESEDEDNPTDVQVYNGFSMVEVNNGTYTLFHENGEEYVVDTTEVGNGRMIYAWVPADVWTLELQDYLHNWDGPRVNTQVTNNGREKG